MPDIYFDFSLQAWHTFGLPARAAMAAVAYSEADLLQAIKAVGQKQLPILFLGEGSNTVFMQNYPGAVVRLAMLGRQWVGEDKDHVYLEVAAGENWHELVKWTLAQGRPGLENLALIPGSVGACPVQNIGAYGLEVMDRIAAVRILHLDTLSFESLPNSSCDFAYRDSIFKHELAGCCVITAVTFRLPKRWQPLANYADIQLYLEKQGCLHPEPFNIFNAVVQVRTRKLPDPKQVGNAGSFFKNPIVSRELGDYLFTNWPGMVRYSQADGRYKLAAAWLIDHCGLKGYAVGSVAVSAQQALVLINQGGGDGASLKALIFEIQRRVNQQFSVILEVEPVLVGAVPNVWADMKTVA